jgi:DNA-binding GntR family transcriptional regulator
MNEEALAQELGMSRTPVRHALQDLVAQGLAERSPGRGVSVSRIDLRTMLDIVEVQQWLLEWCVPRLCERPQIDLTQVQDAYRLQLEGAEAGDDAQVLFAARRMDNAMVALAGNHEMVRYMTEISDRLLFAASEVVTSSGKLNEAVREHGAIVDALVRRDKADALRAVEAHCAGIRRRLMGVPG